MKTLALHKRFCNTYYLQYNPLKWFIEIHPRIAVGEDGIKNRPMINIVGRDIEDGKEKRSYGLFEHVYFCDKPPEYCRFEKWD